LLSWYFRDLFHPPIPIPVMKVAVQDEYSVAHGLQDVV
jgi:hypothetical protein